MRNILISTKTIAVHEKIANDGVRYNYNLFETFGTEYGLFIPLTGTGYQFLRWVKKGMPELPKETNISTLMIHVSNDGEVFICDIISASNEIVLFPYISDDISFVHTNRDTAEAFSYLIKRNCKTFAQALALLEKKEVNGFYKPIIFSVQDWVDHAKEKEWTKLFWHTCFTVPAPEEVK